MAVWITSVAFVAVLAAPVDLRRSDELMSQYKYAEARLSLAKARATKGVDRESLLRILQMQGIAAGQLRLTASAVTSFRELLVLDPTHKLDDDYAPRVMTPFFEAGQLVTAEGALEFIESQVEMRSDSATLGVEVGKDPLNMARAVVFHVKKASGWEVVRKNLKSKRASLNVNSTEVSWWAELLGDNEAQLALVGSETSPRAVTSIQSTPDVPLAQSLPPVGPHDELSPPLNADAYPESDLPTRLEKKSPRASGTALRTASYFVLGTALVTAGIGVGFGVKSSNSFTELKNVQRDENGTITSLTERQAQSVATAAARDGMVANVCFVGAGALAVGGALMWWFGAPVAVVPSPNGVFVSGRLP